MKHTPKLSGNDILLMLSDDEESKKIVHAVNNFNFMFTALNDILSSKNIEEAKSYARKTLSEMQKNSPC